MRPSLASLLALGLLVLASCHGGAATEAQPSRWTRLTEAAPYPGSYNFPVHVAADGRFVALHPEGSWSSRDGVNWTREALAPVPVNTAYMPLIQHKGAAWALGAHRGNYQGFTIDPVIRRTSGDYRAWETVGRSPTLPKLVFMGAASFDGSIWLLGGFDGKAESNAVWRSADGIAWERVAEHAPWSPRAKPSVVVFRDRLWVLGGGAIDGAQANDAWSSADGVNWTRETASIVTPAPTGFTAQVFDRRLWLVGANRSGEFRSEMLVSADGRTWTAVSAPWTPRGGVATWTDGKRMYLTGGKYSYPVNGEPKFVYSNDVWAMDAGGER
ncbi:hypothetical protein P1X14_05200 [Sphingomonas sp. AOB5]|uniref:hypothetical protein n=1 Tax=Sphingomonas sp. AOB5 TaxID=3034017 RepID=UPI0023F69A53|nr:hypothetical protein [Sphingomonas sp. AOB5]MDF7774635.1 hypothetical protein [Sphingomonas sp. AOB5]